MQREKFFKSRVFTRLFLSYVILITAFMGFYAVWYFWTYDNQYAEATAQSYQQKAITWGSAMDHQLLCAQNVCSSVNSSESCRSILQTAYVEKKVINSLQMYKMLNELTRIKGASSNLNIYNILLCFQDDSKAYAAGSVISFDEGYGATLGNTPYMGVSSVASLLNVKSRTNMMLNKEYFIYADHYTSITNASVKGTVLVLFEHGGLNALTSSMLGDHSGMAVYRGDALIVSSGETAQRSFEVESSAVSGLRYVVYVSPDAFHPPFPLSALWPVLIMALLGVLFVTVTYFISKRYYRPIGNIRQMIEGERPQDSRDEIDHILGGIKSLIGERNGYRERMVTITPYAQQGMLHSILSGNVKHNQLQVLIDEKYVELRWSYFMLAVVNLAYVGKGEVKPQQYQDAQELIAHLCRELSQEERSVVSCARDVQNLFVIVNSDDAEDMEPVFHTLHKRLNEELDDPGYAVTIGVSRLESDLERLQAACRDAERALDQMLTGGRDAVYFDEPGSAHGARGYAFPADAQKRIVRDFREGNLPDLRDFLSELYRRNVKEAELSPSELRLMVDELHLTVRASLNAAFGLSTTHVQIERIRQGATIDEIFAYYNAVFETALEQYGGMARKDEQKTLETEVARYVDDNALKPELSLSGVADHFGVSTKMICIICKNAFGATFLQHVREKQIQRAAELLQTTDESLESIAQQCGFTNLLTFRRNFKSVMNMNPSDFRR